MGSSYMTMRKTSTTFHVADRLLLNHFDIVGFNMFVKTSCKFYLFDLKTERETELGETEITHQLVKSSKCAWQPGLGQATGEPGSRPASLRGQQGPQHWAVICCSPSPPTTPVQWGGLILRYCDGNSGHPISSLTHCPAVLAPMPSLTPRHLCVCLIPWSLKVQL